MTTERVLTYHAETAQARLESAAVAGLSWQEFASTAIDALNHAVPFDAICVGLIDPASQLLTGRVDAGLEDGDDAEFLRYEYGVPDYHKITDLSRRKMAVAILDDATGGDPQRSARQSWMLRQLNLRHELRGAIRHDGGLWGGYTLYRSPGRSGFSPAEARFLHRLERTLAMGLRRGLIAGELMRDREVRNGPVILILDPADQVVSATPGAEDRLRELGGDLWARLPVSLSSVVAAARSQVLQGYVPEVRLRSQSGEWLTVHAARVRDQAGATGQIAVSIASAGATRVIPLVVSAYGLSSREREVVQQVLRGATTNEIAISLHLSPYTVQDHLKAVFDKVGVASRGGLTSKIFFEQYAPRFGQELNADGWFKA